jgi:predicted nucleotidyltransferase component of viral defense system
MIRLISREKLEKIARSQLNYTLQDAEKDYFLAIVMRIISESSLSKTLVFKGGTSIYHCYLNQHRFSEDLDFTSVDKNITLTIIEKLFKKYEIFEIKKYYESKYSLKIERLKYEGVLDIPNSIKFEIDRFQNVVLPTMRTAYNNVWGLNFSVNVMSPIEICAEKIRACNDRFRYRDFYDLYLMVKEIKVDIRDILDLLSAKEIRHSISKDRVMRNLNLAVGDLEKNGDNIEYKVKIKTKELKNFFRKLDIPKLKSNVNNT